MSHIEDDGASLTVVICDEPDAKCEACGKVEETRPYGPGGMRLCFDCGMTPEFKTTVDGNLARFIDGLPPLRDPQ